jgi:predicted dinucleotide-binding enzyme
MCATRLRYTPTWPRQAAKAAIYGRPSPRKRSALCAATCLEKAKKTVAQIPRVGWDTEDIGPIEAARPIEALFMLWRVPALKELVAARVQAVAMIAVGGLNCR